MPVFSAVLVLLIGAAFAAATGGRPRRPDGGDCS
jgi:hypothetical protein